MSDETKNEEVSETKPFIDFSDLDNEIKEENKDKKEAVKKEIAAEEKAKAAKEVETSKATSKLEDALSEEPKTKKENKKKEETQKETTVPPMPENKTEIKEQKPKTKEEIVLESEEKENVDEKFIADDSVEITDEEEENLMNSIDPKSRIHRVITEEDEKNNEDFIVDSENKEKIVEEESLSEKEKEEKEERQKKLDALFEKRTGFKVYGGEGGVPCLFASDNPNVKALKEFNIPTDKIKPIENNDEALRKNFLEQYITLTNAKDSTVVDHRVTRFPCLLSGYYAEMTDYSIGELTSVIRVIRNPELKFASKFQQELVSIYNHISWTSLKPDGEKLTFDEWVKATKFKDLDMFYYGAYDATYPGESKYDITCGNCRNQFTVTKTNRALAYLLQNGNDPLLKDTFIKDVLMERLPSSELKKTLIYNKANTNYSDKVLKPHNIRVSYGNPSLLDILEYLAIFESTLDEIEDFEAIIDDSMDGHNVLTMYTMIKSIVVPVKKGKNADGKSVIGFYEVSTEVEDDDQRMENRRYIVEILKSLPESEFAELFTGKEIAERKRLVGITTILHNITCPTCNANISRIPIDMRGNFFMKTATAIDQIDQF
jgi:chemotaxis protein histidine kinase CheA